MSTNCPYIKLNQSGTATRTQLISGSCATSISNTYHGCSAGQTCTGWTINYQNGNTCHATYKANNNGAKCVYGSYVGASCTKTGCSSTVTQCTYHNSACKTSSCGATYRAAQSAYIFRITFCNIKK